MCFSKIQRRLAKSHGSGWTFLKQCWAELFWIRVKFNLCGLNNQPNDQERIADDICLFDSTGACVYQIQSKEPIKYPEMWLRDYSLTYKWNYKQSKIRIYVEMFSDSGGFLSYLVKGRSGAGLRMFSLIYRLSVEFFFIWQLLVSFTDLSYHLKRHNFSADSENFDKFLALNQFDLASRPSFFRLNFFCVIKKQAKVISFPKFFIFPSPYSLAQQNTLPFPWFIFKSFKLLPL